MKNFIKFIFTCFLRLKYLLSSLEVKVQGVSTIAIRIIAFIAFVVIEIKDREKTRQVKEEVTLRIVKNLSLKSLDQIVQDRSVNHVFALKPNHLKFKPLLLGK